MKFGIINFFCQLKRTVCNREVSILKQCDCVCIVGVSVRRGLTLSFNSNNNINNNK